jgi:hypothetical protein
MHITKDGPSFQSSFLFHYIYRYLTPLEEQAFIRSEREAKQFVLMQYRSILLPTIFWISGSVTNWDCQQVKDKTSLYLSASLTIRWGFRRLRIYNRDSGRINVQSESSWIRTRSAPTWDPPHCWDCQQKIKLVTRTTASTRNKNVYSINSVSTT